MGETSAARCWVLSSKEDAPLLFSRSRRRSELFAHTPCEQIANDLKRRRADLVVDIALGSLPPCVVTGEVEKLVSRPSDPLRPPLSRNELVGDDQAGVVHQLDVVLDCFRIVAGRDQVSEA